MHKDGITRIDEFNGLVTRLRSSVYTVLAEDGRRYDCSIRGRLLETANEGDLVAIGDRVRFQITDKKLNRGAIETIAPRKSSLSRAQRTQGLRGAGTPEREQVLVANADVALFVFSIAQPTPSLRMLDRFLIAGERARISRLVIVINKMDLCSNQTEETETKLKYYEHLGYPFIWTSTLTGEGLDHFRAQLNQGIAVVCGPSGVGKTSLLNAIQSDLSRRVPPLGAGRGGGLHTTRDRELVPLSGGGYLADTPGLRTLNFWDLEPQELDAYFREIAPLVTLCRFRDCSHHQEPACAVREQVKMGVISPSRYQSYLTFYAELAASYEI